MELRPQHVDQVVGSVIRFSCKYNSREPLSIEFETMFSGYRTPDAEFNPPQESYRHYQWGSERFWNVTIVDGLLLVTCRVRNADGVIIGRLTTVIGKGALLFYRWYYGAISVVLVPLSLCILHSLGIRSLLLSPMMIASRFRKVVLLWFKALIFLNIVIFLDWIKKKKTGSNFFCTRFQKPPCGVVKGEINPIQMSYLKRIFSWK